MIENKKTCGIIIPCYNEEDVIFESLKRLTSFLKQQTAYSWRILCVNDGSTDRTVAEIERFLEQYTDPHVSVNFRTLTQNAGKGYAIQEGVKHLDVGVYGFIDADLSLEYESMVGSLPSLLGSADVVIAMRNKKHAAGYSWFRSIGSSLFSRIAGVLFSLPFRDTQCGLKFFSRNVREVLLSVQQTRFSFDVEFLVRSRARGFRIREYAVDWKHNAQSSVQTRDAVRYMLDLLLIVDQVYTTKRFLIIYALTACGITMVLFGWTMVYGFFFSDDFTWIWHGSRIWQGELSVWTAHMSTFYSPVLNAFYAGMSRVVGLAAWPYFFFGMVVHAVNAFLVGVMVKKMTQTHIAGFFAVVLFSLTGGAYEPLVWIGANMHSIATMGMVASAVCLLNAFDSHRVNRVLWFFGSILAYVFAILSKEIAVITPAILLFLSMRHWYVKKRNFISAPVILYWVGVIAISFFYIWKQYIWQKESVWVSSGLWHLHGGAFARLPIALLDVFVPLQMIAERQGALLLSILSCGLFTYCLYRFRKNSTVLVGFLWASVAALPVLFFQTITWWELFPSRYTYSIRVGMVIFVAAMIADLLQHGKEVRLAHRFFWVLVFASLLHTVNMVHILNTEYGYVYQTGRALHTAAVEVSGVAPTRVIIPWYRPFNKNNAHIVGALWVMARIPEKNIIFLEKDEPYSALPGDVLLEWSDTTLRYHLRPVAIQQ